jgi:hypothetical protein
MSSPTYRQCALDWDLWCEWVNPGGDMSREEFDALTINERVALEIDCFGPELWTCERCGLEYAPIPGTEPDGDTLCPTCEAKPIDCDALVSAGADA